MSQCTEAEVQRMLPLVSAQRREQALRYRHVFGQWACLKSWLMVINLANYQSEKEKKLSPLEWKYNEYGKPYFEDGWEFSISHCKCGIAVALGLNPVGIDIECIRDVRPELVERTMNEAEQVYIGNDARKFTELWTKKEAYLKYKGTGIIDDLNHVLDDTNGVYLETTITKNYVYTICEGKLADVK